MSTREERLGAEVLQLVDHFHSRRNEHGNREHPLRTAVTIGLEALALMSLARRVAPRGIRRFASLAAASYLKHRADAHRGRS